MIPLTVLRSAGRTWLAAILSVPFLMAGLDLLLLPRLFPQYVRRLDRLADEMGLNRITTTGPEEPWGLIFLVVGGGLLIWALKDLLFPTEMLRIDDHGVAFASVLGPAGGRIVVPRSEIVGAAPALLTEGRERSLAVGIRVADPARLPSSPWGAVWAHGTLFIRTDGWTVKPGVIASVLTDSFDEPDSGYVVDLETEPPTIEAVEGDPTYSPNQGRAAAARNRAYAGAVLALAGLILLLFMWIADTDNMYYLLAIALGAGGGWLFLDSYRSYLEST